VTKIILLKKCDYIDKTYFSKKLIIDEFNIYLLAGKNLYCFNQIGELN